MNVKKVMWVVGVWVVLMIGITVIGLNKSNQRNREFYDRAIDEAPTPACAIMWRCRSEPNDNDCWVLSQACARSLK